MTRPAVTTRPLYWLAQERGKDYTDVLNVAWGIKCLITQGAIGPGKAHHDAYYASLERIIDANDDTPDGSTTYQEICNRVSALIFLQSTLERGDTAQLSQHYQDRIAAETTRCKAAIQ